MNHIFDQVFKDFAAKNISYIYTDNPVLPVINIMAVGIIKSAVVNDFMKVIHEVTKQYMLNNPQNAEYYRNRLGNVEVWTSATGSKFITSYWGLYFILDKDLELPTYNVGGLEVVWPDSVVKAMEENQLPYHFTVVKAVKKKPDDWLKAKFEEKRIKEEIEARSQEVYKRAIQEIHNLLDIDLAKQVLSFDIFYDYSDDINVYRRGVKEENRLIALLDSRGHNGLEVLRKVRKARSA